MKAKIVKNRWTGGGVHICPGVLIYHRLWPAHCLSWNFPVVGKSRVMPLDDLVEERLLGPVALVALGWLARRARSPGVDPLRVASVRTCIGGCCCCVMDSLVVGNARPVQAYVSLDKTVV